MGSCYTGCYTVATRLDMAGAFMTAFKFGFGSGAGIRTLNLAVNRSLHPVQKCGFEFAPCRCVPPFAKVYRRRRCTKLSRLRIFLTIRGGSGMPVYDGDCNQNVEGDSPGHGHHFVAGAYAGVGVGLSLTHHRPRAPHFLASNVASLALSLRTKMRAAHPATPAQVMIHTHYACTQVEEPPKAILARGRPSRRGGAGRDAASLTTPSAGALRPSAGTAADGPPRASGRLRGRSRRTRRCRCR